ncbi:MAG: DUF839 domain-containing protein [Acidobacteria bacterium]|nr:DUF839 domain-containing protein [Acidobacteriota bacterium]
MKRRTMLSSLGAFLAACTVKNKGRTASATKAVGWNHWTPLQSPLAGQATFDVADELQVPEGFRYRVVARWGDTFGPQGRTIRVGSNCDFTGLVPMADKPGDYYLIINHETVSTRAWLVGASEFLGYQPPEIHIHGKERTCQIGDQSFSSLEVALSDMNAAVRASVVELAHQIIDDHGVSILHVREDKDGIHVVPDSPRHKRISPVSTRFSAPIAPRPSAFTGPVASLLTEPIRGTICNCSGGVTPWGTFLTCEENIDEQVQEEVQLDGSMDAQEPHIRFYWNASEQAAKLPTHIYGLGSCLEKPLDGRTFGWVTEINPDTGQLTKHSCLGRFRHENAGLRVVAGRPLEVFMGDDRRGGHVWRYQSRQSVTDPASPSNSELLADGTLYVAQLNVNQSGKWIPLRPETPLVKPQPEITAKGLMWVPSIKKGRVSVGAGAEMTSDAWCAEVAQHAGKPFEDCTLGDLVTAPKKQAQAIILMDAFAFANAAGGTPSARPEDVEVAPDGSVFAAFTNADGSSEGSPSALIFPEAVDAVSSRYGCIMRLKSEGPVFTWQKFVLASHAKHGFACADNLAFDADGDLWFTTDVSTGKLNQNVVKTKSKPGDGSFQGVFGNNCFFRVKRSGPDAGRPQLFAMAPCEAELTGPTFSPSGDSLILSVQHPGELHGPYQGSKARRSFEFETDDGWLTQTRHIPLGSNFPSSNVGQVPRAVVVCITPSKDVS